MRLLSATPTERHSVLRSTARTIRRRALAGIVAVLLGAAASAAEAQVSFYTAIDLAMRNNNKVRAAEADVLKAQAALAQTKDIYIPDLIFGMSVGKFYGFPVGTPTLFNITSQSLLFNFSQHDYIRAARAEVQASQLSLRQAQLDIEEDTALAYMDLDRALQQQKALGEQAEHVDTLSRIMQERFGAGLEDKTEMTRTRLSAANIRLKQLQNDGTVDSLRDHLARATGLPAATLTTVPDSVPASPPLPENDSGIAPMPPSVAAAFADAKAKREIAFGDSRQLYRPEFNFVAQYNYFSGLYNYSTYYNHFQNSNESIGFQLNFPLFDANRRARSRQSSAEATRVERDADVARDQAAEGDLKLQHALREQRAQLEVAKLEQELAQDQLDSVLLQLKSGGGRPGAPALTPKDEQNARIDALQHSMELIDLNFAVERTQLDLLKASGTLEDWIRKAAEAAPSPSSSVPAPVPAAPAAP